MHSVKPPGSLHGALPGRFPPDRHGRILRVLECCFIVFAILVFSRALVLGLFDAVSPGSITGLNETAEAPPVIRQPKLLWLYLCIYIGTVLLILPRLRQVFRALFAEKYVLLLILLAALSILWSTDPRESLVKVVGLSFCTMFGVYLAIRYTTRQQLQLLATAFSLIMIASVFLAVHVPEIGVMHGIHEGIWCGVFVHKNAFGSYMILAGIVFMLLMTDDSKYRFFYLAAFWLSLILLSLSCSKISLLSWITLFTLFTIHFARLRRPKLAVIASLSVALVLCSFVMQYKYKVLPPILLAQISAGISTSSNETSSLADLALSEFETAQRNAPYSASVASGDSRVRLWGHLWKKIEQRPWLGYGVGGFWRGMQGPSADIWKLETWRPPGAHNGFIDVWLDLGVIGLAIVVLSIACACIGSIVPIVNATLDLDLLFPLAILIGLCLVKMGESGLFGVNIMSWILLVTAVINVQKTVRQRAASARSPTYTKTSGALL